LGLGLGLARRGGVGLARLGVGPRLGLGRRLGLGPWMGLGVAIACEGERGVSVGAAEPVRWL
jgi:hypothetical protein